MTCPLCGGPTECGVEAGKSTCWCFDMSMPPDVLEQVPADQRGVACICQKCAAQAKPVSDLASDR